MQYMKGQLIEKIKHGLIIMWMVNYTMYFIIMTFVLYFLVVSPHDTFQRLSYNVWTVAEGSKHATEL